MLAFIPSDKPRAILVGLVFFTLGLIIYFDTLRVHKIREREKACEDACTPFRIKTCTDDGGAQCYTLETGVFAAPSASNSGGIFGVVGGPPNSLMRDRLAASKPQSSAR